MTRKKGKASNIRELILAVVMAMAAGKVYALGLGEIEVYSALNEPLNADIRLVADQPGELTNAVVRLAGNEEFTRAGVERRGVLSDINFTIVRHDDGTAVVKVTSTQPIREPFLDIIVQLRWQSGRLLREYTLLLDPPVIGGEKSAPVAAPVIAASVAEAAAPAPSQQPAPEPAVTTAPPVAAVAAPAPASAPVPAAEPMPQPQQQPQSQLQAETPPPAPAPAPPGKKAAPRRAPAPAAQGASTYGPTKNNETLWMIASAQRPDDTVSVYQMMLALLKTNPQAFYNGNVNSLKAGYVLRLPDRAMITALSQDEAVKESARQYAQWLQKKRGSTAAAPAAAAETGATAAPPEKAAETPDVQPSAATPAQEKEKARLRLVAPSETGAKSAKTAGAQADVNKLRNDLAIAQEASDAAKRENEELHSRLSALEGQIKSQQRLLTLKEDALADMQKRLGSKPPAVPAPAKPAAPEISITPPSTDKPAPAKSAKPAVSPAPKTEQAASWTSDPTLLGAVAGAVVLVGALVWVVIRRRRNDDEVIEEPRIEIATPAEVVQEEGQEPSLMLEGEEGTNPRMEAVAEEVARDTESSAQDATSDLDVMHTPEGEIDPLVEADVYLAYRRYQQAEALLQNALAKQPQRHEIKVKLLEVYYASKNVESFESVAQSLYADLGQNTGDALWQRIVPMGRDICPRLGIFGPVAESGDGVSTGYSPEPLNLDVETPADHSMSAALEDKLDLDLNLGGEVPAAETVQTQSTVARGRKQPDEHWQISSAMSDFSNVELGFDDADLLAGTDVVGTKLDLARAYMDMGDQQSARDILKEVAEEGSDQQKKEAKTLLEKLA